MKEESFRNWIGRVAGLSEGDCQQLIESRLAEQFLISWHFSETNCFARDCRPAKFQAFASRYLNSNSFVLDHFLHFHARYQDGSKLRNLMHKTSGTDINRILSISPNLTSNTDKIVLLLTVVHRYRNNMFHGNKGLHSWLAYRTQIHHCIRVLQVLAEMKP